MIEEINNDTLSEKKIRLHLKTKKIGKKLIVLDVVDSTNNYVKNMGVALLDQDFVVISNEQTHGRGCGTNHFISEPEAGIYMSISLSSFPSLENMGIMIQVIAVAICEAVFKVFGIQCYVKWLNDIFYNNKKLGGILIEAGSYNGKPIIVMGIGLNVENEPHGLEDITTSIYSILRKKGYKNQLLAEILNSFEKLYLDCFRTKNNFRLIEFKYKQLVCSETRKYTFLVSESEFDGYIIDVENFGKTIIVKDEINNIKIVNFEDVKIKPCKLI